MWRNKIKVFHDGLVKYDMHKVIKSSCRANVDHYPFDKQECTLKFGSWFHHGLDIEIRVKVKLAEKRAQKLDGAR